MMRYRLLYIVLLLMAVQLAMAQSSAQQYEYWMNNDYGNRSINTANGLSEISFTIDARHLPSGVNFLNFRMQSESGQWGGLMRHLVYMSEKVDNTGRIAAYEYWMDNDYSSRTRGENFVGSMDIDVSDLSEGVHFFNFRARDGSGYWGALSRTLIYLPSNISTSGFISSYEYWIDNDYGKRVIGSNLTGALSIEASGLSEGIHFFNFRAKMSTGQWGALSRHLILIQPKRIDKKDKLAQIKWWIDDNVEKLQLIEVQDSVLVLEIDVNDLESNEHAFNIIAQTASGKWLLPESSKFVLESRPLVPTPKVTPEGNTIKIEDADSVDNRNPINYYYTLDGSNPNLQSTLYEKPFEVLRNNTLKVVGYQKYHDPSEMATLEIDWFKVADPEFTQVGNKLSIASDTTRATIYYKIGPGMEKVYREPIRLADQTTVTAVGRLDGFHDSQTVTFTPQTVKTATPVVEYDGRYATIRKNDANEKQRVTIYYTLDGSKPYDGLDVAKGAILYDSKLTIDTLCNIRAVGIIEDLNVSDEASSPVDYLYNDETSTAYVRNAGVLEKAFDWCGTDGMKRLSVEGPLGSKDLDLLKSSFPALSHLNLSKATLESGQLAGNAFEGAPFVSFVSPVTISSAGGQLFRNCPRLAAVVWNANVRLLSNTFEGVNNPNLLLYVNSNSLNQTSVTNVVEAGTAAKITLSDAATGNNNFYCPQEFTAQDISYTHNYQQETVIGHAQGWETLSLPFTVQTVSHERNGTLLPFYAEGEGKPFWLMELTESGLAFAQTIEANRPYVISMPNNPSVYADAYNQAGRVTFSARNTLVPATSEQETSGAGVTLHPAFQAKARSQGVYALNVGEARDGHPEGSVFVPDYREVRPFEAYATSMQAARSFIGIEELSTGDETSAIHDIVVRGSGRDDHYYNLKGLRVTTPRKGVFLKGGKKVVVK